MPARRFKFLTIVWALLLAIGVIAMAGSVLLPSTKRARVDWAELRRRQEAADAAETQPASFPPPAPASAPSTESHQTAHDLTWHILGAGASFLALFAMFRPAESVLPRRPG